VIVLMTMMVAMMLLVAVMVALHCQDLAGMMNNECL